MIGGDALEPADRDRLFFDPPAPAGGLARTIANAPEDAGEHVRFSVQQISVGETLLSDEPDVFGDVGVGRAGPLAIYDLVVILRIGCIGWPHGALPRLFARGRIDAVDG